MKQVINIKGLFKEYKLGVIGHGTLYKDLQSWYAKLKGKEDPNSLINSANSKNIKSNILAIKNLNLSVNKGEILGIIGSNGAGKSTLLKILSRVTTPSMGEIEINGSFGSLLEVGTGFHNELTGLENIYLNGSINGMSQKEVDKVIKGIIDFSGLEKFINTPVKRYSSGMKVRLGFAVASFLKHDILAIDEVLAVGDHQFHEKAISKVNSLMKNDGRTILFVSHNMNLIEKICTRVIILENGQIINSGGPREMVSEYLRKSRNTNFSETKMLSNKLHRRGNGKVRISSFNLHNKEGEKTNIFKNDEKIIFKFKIKKFEEVKDAFIEFNFRSIHSNETIFSLVKDLNELPNIKTFEEVDYEFSFEIENIIPNTFDLYIKVSEKKFKGQMDIIEGMLPPVIIDNKNDEKFLDKGYFKFKSFIKKIN